MSRFVWVATENVDYVSCHPLKSLPLDLKALLKHQG